MTFLFGKTRRMFLCKFFPLVTIWLTESLNFNLCPHNLQTGLIYVCFSTPVRYFFVLWPFSQGNSPWKTIPVEMVAASAGTAFDGSVQAWFPYNMIALCFANFVARVEEKKKSFLRHVAAYRHISWIVMARWYLEGICSTPWSRD